VIYWPSKEVDPRNLRYSFRTGELWEGAPSWGLGELGIGKNKWYGNTKGNPEATYAVHKFTTLPSYKGSLHRKCPGALVTDNCWLIQAINMCRNTAEGTANTAWVDCHCCQIYSNNVGRNISVGVANRYLPDGPWIATGWRYLPHLFQTILALTQSAS